MLVLACLAKYFAQSVKPKHCFLNVYSFNDSNVEQMRVNTAVFKLGLNLSDSWKTFHQPKLEDNEKGGLDFSDYCIKDHLKMHLDYQCFPIIPLKHHSIISLMMIQVTLS